MATGPITKTSVDKLTCPPNKDREIPWDGGHREAVRGFGVAALRNGGKCYIAQYRKDGRSRRTRIGEHGRLTPEQARKEARKVLGLVEGGRDPIAERRAAREIRTFRPLRPISSSSTSRPSVRRGRMVYRVRKQQATGGGRA